MRDKRAPASKMLVEAKLSYLCRLLFAHSKQKYEEYATIAGGTPPLNVTKFHVVGIRNTRKCISEIIHTEHTTIDGTNMVWFLIYNRNISCYYYFCNEKYFVMKINSNRAKLDEIDWKILEILQSNAKITNAQLSKDIGLSPAPSLERVKKLEMSGVIKSYHAVLNTEQIGLSVNTFVQVSLKGHNKKNIDLFVKEINKIPEIIECHHTTGSGDFILRIIASDIPSYQKLMLEKVSDIEIVEGLQSMVILSTFKDSKVMPIPENER